MDITERKRRKSKLETVKDAPEENIDDKEVPKVAKPRKSSRFPTFGCLTFFFITFLSVILISFFIPEPHDDQHPYIASVAVCILSFQSSVLSKPSYRQFFIL